MIKLVCLIVLVCTLIVGYDLNPPKVSAAPSRAIGDLGAALIDDESFAAGGLALGADPELIHVRENIYMVAYQQSTTSTLLMKTFSISTVGVITPTVLDTVTITGSGTGPDPSVVKVTNGLIALTYGPSGGNGIVRTYSVSTGGLFTLVDTFTFTTAFFGNNTGRISHVSDDVYAVVARDDNVSSFRTTISTLQITSSGDITAIDEANSFSSDLTDGSLTRLGFVRNAWGVFAYDERTTDDGEITTFPLTAAGTVTTPRTSTLTFSTGVISTPHLAVVDAALGIVTVLFADGATVNLETFSVSALGALTQTDADNAIGGTTADNHVMALGDRKVIFWPSGTAIIKTYSSDASGTMTLYDSLTLGFNATGPTYWCAVSSTVMATAMFDTSTDVIRIVTIPAENEASSQYEASGTGISPALNVGAITNVAFSYISWGFTLPANTTLNVAVSFDQTTWTTATNAAAIPIISSGDNLTGKNLYVRATLTTSDTSITPEVDAIYVSVQDVGGLGLYYKLNSFPGPTIDDRSNNSNTGVVSAPPMTPLTLVTSFSEFQFVTNAEPVTLGPDVATEISQPSNFYGGGTCTGVVLVGSLIQAMSDLTDGQIPEAFFCITLATLSTIVVGVISYMMFQSLPMSAAGMATTFLFFANMSSGVLPLWAFFFLLMIIVGLYLISRPGAI